MENFLHKLSIHRFSPFSGGLNLFIFALLCGIIVIILYGYSNETDNGKWTNFFGSFTASFVEDVIFFAVFTFGLLLITQKMSLFSVLRGSEDFNCNDEIKHVFEGILKKLGAYNEKYIVDIDFKQIDFDEMKCNLDVTTTCKIGNLSKRDVYKDQKKSSHVPGKADSKEQCEIIAVATANTMEELQRKQGGIDESSVVRTESGKVTYSCPIEISPSGSLWTRSVYRYAWPIRDLDTPRWQSEEHNFSSTRISQSMELRARNSSPQRVRLTIESTREGSETSVVLEANEALFNSVVTHELVEPHDTGLIQVYVEPVEQNAGVTGITDS